GRLAHYGIDQFTLWDGDRDVRSKYNISLLCEARSEFMIDAVRLLTQTCYVLRLAAESVLAHDGGQRPGMLARDKQVSINLHSVENAEHHFVRRVMARHLNQVCTRLHLR